MQLKDFFEFVGILLVFAGAAVYFWAVWPVILCGLLLIALGNSGESKT